MFVPNYMASHPRKDDGNRCEMQITRITISLPLRILWCDCICLKDFYSWFIFKGRHNIKSVLLNLCETERENQLSWICTEIRHLNNLKQLSNLDASFCCV
jgi:hypothetical protein